MNDIEGLSWNLPQETQNENIYRILNTPGYNWDSLILPGERKDCWMNCAKIIEQLPDEKIIPLSLRLMEWLQDGNWPGADAIIKRLLRLPQPTLVGLYQQIYMKALIENDEEWIYYLDEAFGDIIDP